MLTDIDVDCWWALHQLLVGREEVGGRPDTKEKSRLRDSSVFTEVVEVFANSQALKLFSVDSKILD